MFAFQQQMLFFAFRHFVGQPVDDSRVVAGGRRGQPSVGEVTAIVRGDA
jgi:hypothetical protein